MPRSATRFRRRSLRCPLSGNIRLKTDRTPLRQNLGHLSKSIRAICRSRRSARWMPKPTASLGLGAEERKMAKAGGGDKSGLINRAAGEKPKREVMGKPNVGSVGNERYGDVHGTQMGGSAAEAANNPLKGAVQHIHSEHPHPYTDMGP